MILSTILLVIAIYLFTMLVCAIFHAKNDTVFPNTPRGFMKYTFIPYVLVNIERIRRDKH